VVLSFTEVKTRRPAKMRALGGLVEVQLKQDRVCPYITPAMKGTAIFTLRSRVMCRLQITRWVQTSTIASSRKLKLAERGCTTRVLMQVPSVINGFHLFSIGLQEKVSTNALPI
jgi:hypothetical protein